MTLMKRVSPFDEFSSIASENGDRCSRLMRYIVDYNKQDSFNFYINEEVFPEGVEFEEFREFCLEEQDEIIDNI